MPSLSVNAPRPFMSMLILPLFSFCMVICVGCIAWAVESDSCGFLSERLLISQHSGATGAYVLEKGEEALLARTWMVDNATESIDILTFIWSLDNVGLVATDALLRAAERGVKVRAVVDDIVLKKKDLDVLLALSAHPNFEIRIYNPMETVGVSMANLVINVLTDFRQFNQRLHNKTFLADGIIGLTGGRNVANEYFNYDQKYNFLDRDILVIGPVAGSMQDNFEIYWQSELSRPIEQLLASRLSSFSQEEITEIYREMHICANRLVNQLPLVQQILKQRKERMDDLLAHLVWTEQIWFISDLPGKNIGKPGLGGGGALEHAIAQAISEAQEEITLQSPYLVFEEGAYGLYEKLAQGVEVRISTNSLASTDNIAAFSGYAQQRQKLLNAGFLIREFQPHPAIENKLLESYLRDREKKPIFVLHAKSLIVDKELLYVGTFNIDPRSAHLNTEEGVFVRNRQLAQQVEGQIVTEMRPENSWNPRLINPDRKASWWRRIRLLFYKWLPIEPLL